MRNIILFIIILFFIYGCEKENDLGFEVTEGDRLINYTHYSEFSNQTDIDFIHNDQGQLIKFVSNGGSGTVSLIDYDENGNVVEMNSKSRKRTFSYDSENKLTKYRSYRSDNDGETFVPWPFVAGYNFHYDNHGIINRIESIYRDSLSENSTPYGYSIKNSILHWKDGNVVKSEDYNREGKIAVTRLYEYDNKNNIYQHYPKMVLPSFVSVGFTRTHAAELSKNNVVKETTVDHLGYYPSVVCRVCKTIYKYNSNGLPVMYRNPDIPDRYTVLTYE